MEFSSVYDLNLGAASIIKIQGLFPGAPVMKFNVFVLETEVITIGVSCEHGNELLGSIYNFHNTR